MITKLNNFINKKILLIFTIFLFMQPVLDIITGIMIYSKSSIYSISAIIRIIFLIFMMYYITFIKKTKFFKLFLIILLYSVIFCLVNYIFKDNGNLVIEIKNLLNNIYLPITMIFIFEIFNNNKFDIKKIYMILLIYLLSVFIPNILGIGFDSYAYSKEGSVGFFYSANAIGSIISMLFPIFICELIKQKNLITMVENVIKAKGIEDIVIIPTNNDNINVVIKSKEDLTQQQIAQIQQILVDQLGANANKISIECKK